MRNIWLCAAFIMVGMIAAAHAVTRDERGKAYKQCLQHQLSQEQFESTGGKLIVIKQASLDRLPREMLPKIGGMTLHGLVLEDGLVIGSGWDHYIWDDKGALGGVLVDRLEKMRFAPPRIAGKSYCVDFDATWDAEVPQVMPIRKPSQ